MSERPTKAILRVLNGEPVWPLPIWIMRQAGRYLPEYRETRKQAGSFLDLCYNPRLAEEVTLQPIRRFGFDASILFSDILVIPHALGQDVRFVENEGPKLDPVTSEQDFSRLAEELPLERLDPVFETLDRLSRSPAGGDDASRLLRRALDRGELHDRRQGHAGPGARPGSPPIATRPSWMRSSTGWCGPRPPISSARSMRARKRCRSSRASGRPCRRRSSTGCRSNPIRRMVEGLKGARPQAKVIVFVRGGGANLHRFAAAGIGDGLALDWTLDPARVLPTLPATIATQGNLDPLALIAGGDALDDGVDHILDAVRGRPHIFNLGHGILPETPIDHVERLIARVRGA